MKKKKNISQILITSNTLSSSKIISKYKFKKVVHQFFPIDTNFLSKKFLNYWKPSVSFFVDSEVWPNMLTNLKGKKIPIILLNGRITNKSFNRWMKVKKFSNLIFDKFDLCICSTLKSKNYLKKLGAKKLKYFGNLKFSQAENEKVEISQNIKKFIKGKKIWCASSTHDTEEKLVGLVHKNLKKKYKNLLTIIIPRHINRITKIENDLKQMGLKTHLHEPVKKISPDTDIYLVNAYGLTKSFFSLCKNVFLGGSIIRHGGQNPLEAVRYGCNILHGPNISNFKEIYDFLKTNNISQKITNEKKMMNFLIKLFSKKSDTKKIQNKLNSIGQKILDSTYKEVKLIL